MNKKMTPPTTWIRKVVVLVLTGLILYQPAFAAHIPITVEEEDGSPSIANIKKIQVANNKLTSLGNGNLLLNLNGDVTAATNFTDNGLIMADGTAGLESTNIMIAADSMSGIVNLTATGTVQGATVNGSTVTADALTITGASSLTGTVSVVGNSTLNGTLGVTGATTLSSTLAVTGAATFSSTAAITGNTTVGGTLGVTGATTLSSTLGVTGAATFSSTTNTTGNATMNANVLIADGQAAPSADANFGKIYVNGDNLYYLPANVAAEPFLLNNGSIAAAGANTEVIFNDGGLLNGDAGFTYIKGTDTLQVNGTINGSTVTADALTITGASTFTGNVGITGDVNHTGNINTTGNITASATVTGLLVQGTTVNGSSLTGDALTITGDSTFTGNIGVTGDITNTGNITMNGNLALTGNSTFTGTVGITGATSITGTLTASDDFTVDTSTLFVDASANQVGIGITSPVALLTVNGVTAIAETAAPSGALSNYGRFYVGTDNELYYMDEAGVATSLTAGTSTTNIRAVSATDSVVTTDHTIVANAASGAITLSLPALTGGTYEGRTFIIKKSDSSANFVTVDPNGSDTIDGASSYDINVQNESIVIQAMGTAWYIL